jgi:aryl-alcohol dehydrogenase
MVSTRAIVTYDPEDDSADPVFKMEDLEVDEPLEDEVLVQMIATGICHTDIYNAVHRRDGNARILGHEGIADRI